MFASQGPNDPQPNAISAVKALQIASIEGQRIYQITQANISTVLPNIHHDQGTMDEIRASLNAGKEVITHASSVSVPGWSGAGYIILDPETGAGAYKISGGSNGGLVVLLSFIGTLLIAAGAVLTATGIMAPIGIAMITAGLLCLSAAVAIVQMPRSAASWSDIADGFMAAVAVISGIGALVAGGVAATAVATVAAVLFQLAALAGLIYTLYQLISYIYEFRNNNKIMIAYGYSDFKYAV
ncbi:MAG: hypothetical protein KZQ89_16350 [Candidatus Thiodiazotropha sp. (ex Lucinoma kastoroae)]|nr:hypothetical protein [Candidatus Thiodiazotropha sp. (ex Lucinoma kastoroae)]